MEHNFEEWPERLVVSSTAKGDTDPGSMYPVFSAFFHPSDMVKYFKHWVRSQMSPESLRLFKSHPEGMEKFEQATWRLVKIYEEANSTRFLEDWRYQLGRCLGNLQHHFGSGIVFFSPHH